MQPSRGLPEKPGSSSAQTLAEAGFRKQSLGQIAAAAQYYDSSLRADPFNPVVWNNLGASLLALGIAPQAVRSFAEAKKLQPANTLIASNFLYALLHDWTSSPARISRHHVAYGRALAVPSAPLVPAPRMKQRLRVGYISAGLGAHATFQFFHSILRAHDPKKVEVYCYSTRSKHDAMSAELRRFCAGWFELCELDDERAIDLIRSHRLDILVERGGYIEENRVPLLAHRLAPVQVTTIDYPATLGLESVQYYITDSKINPASSQRLYVEKLWNLPIAMCYSPPVRAPRVGPLPALRNGFVTFSVFHRLCKLSPAILEAWALILQRVPGSRLLFHHAYGAQPKVAASLRYRTESILERHGISRRRLKWIGRVPSHRESMSFYGDADLTLDTFPYSGCTTTAESLYMGVPVVTVFDRRAMSRHSLSLLSAMGLTEFAATSFNAYVETAVRWANDLESLAVLRRGLRKAICTSPLCEAESYTRNLEAAYRKMWRLACMNPDPKITA